ncbi:TPA: response regulator transcription factor [Enterobacter asburiae]|uniref:helix-turn-helix transcriptional regulator n=1 Tax=Enterobacter asburiae TaxID=61645 RepID=UPI00075E5775|nr:LuxR C-terminal-related transcriptional regulator [Enterobacter asburiae]SAG78571.1 Response regulator containing a CheY-like receiver domain and an HTH DNA-binding domain [Enterobacter cloacae]KVJ91917.1 helix-turn-helix transcriptional regulator [Enterobacter asburiae]MDL4614300.1 LuxR C-terminal-related transcriptional regulator [Enterobacter asburiae]HCM9129799.1 response regulator transcription factor [Enterobacter asburiae]HDW1996486.1 response regulator transcription factor [Enteroba
MINIVIKESDALFKIGLKWFFTEVFFKEVRGDFLFHSEFTADAINSADVVVISLCPGESFVCYPELKARRKGIVIGLVDDVERSSVYPSCFQDIVFISKRATLSHLKNVVLTAWMRSQSPGRQKLNFSCFECQQKSLSPKQVKIMAGLCQGKTIQKIAEELNISEKTVFTHKYMVMRKFNLRSDRELLMLLKRMAEIYSWPNVFHVTLRD